MYICGGIGSSERLKPENIIVGDSFWNKTVGGEEAMSSVLRPFWIRYLQDRTEASHKNLESGKVPEPGIQNWM